MMTSDRTRKVLHGSISNLLRLVLSLVFSLYLPHFLVHHMAASEYSAWVLILQLSAYVNFLEFGIQTAVSKFVAEYEARGELAELHRTVSSAFVMLSAGGALGLFAVALLSWQVPTLFHAMPASLWPEVRLGLLAIGCSTAIGLPFSTFTSVFIGLQQYAFPTIIATLSRALSMGAIIVTLIAGGSLLRAALVLAGFNLATSFAMYVGWKGLAHDRAPLHFAAATRPHLIRLARYCGVLSVWTFGGLFISGLDTLIVGHFDYRNTGYYAVAASATNFAIMLLGSLVSPLMPASASFGVVSTPEQMGSVLLRATRYSTVLLFLIGLPLYMGGHLLLRLWVGESYADRSLIFLHVLLIANVIRNLMYVYTLMVVGGGKQRYATLSPATEAVVNFSLSLMLAHRYGAIGVAWGTLAGSVVGVLLHLTQSMPRTQGLLRFRRLQLIAAGAIRPGIVLLPSALVLAARYWLPAANTMQPWWSLLVAVATGTLAWRVALDENERRDVSAYISSRWRGTPRPATSTLP